MALTAVGSVSSHITGRFSASDGRRPARCIGRGVMAERTHGISACGCSALPASRGVPAMRQGSSSAAARFWARGWLKAPSRPNALVPLKIPCNSQLEPNKNKGFGLNTNPRPPFFTYLPLNCELREESIGRSTSASTRLGIINVMPIFKCQSNILMNPSADRDKKPAPGKSRLQIIAF